MVGELPVVHHLQQDVDRSWWAFSISSAAARNADAGDRVGQQPAGRAIRPRDRRDTDAIIPHRGVLDAPSSATAPKSARQSGQDEIYADGFSGSRNRAARTLNGADRTGRRALVLA